MRRNLGPRTLARLALRPGQHTHELGEVELLLFTRQPILELHLAVLGTTTHDDDAGVPDELSIRHLGAEAFRAVVEHHAVAGIHELAAEGICELLLSRILILHRHDADLVRGDVPGPLETLFIIVLLSDGLDAPGGPDAVAAHPRGQHFSVLVLEGQAHLRGIALLQHEDVPELDAPLEVELALRTQTATVALDRVVEVMVLLGPLEVCSPIHVQQMIVRFTAPAEEVHHAFRGHVEEDLIHLLHAKRPGKPDFSTRDFLHHVIAGDLQGFAAQEIAQLGDVDLQVAAAAHRDAPLGFHGRIRHEDDGLHHLVALESEELFEVLDGARDRGVFLAHRPLRCVIGFRIPFETRRGLFLVGTVAAVVADEEAVHARVTHGHELRRTLSADRTGIRLHADEVEVHALEAARIGSTHRLIGDAHAGFVHVEGVEILHSEFPAPEQPALGTGFLAELLTDLVQEERKLAPGLQPVTHVGGDQFLSRGRESELGFAEFGGEHDSGMLVLFPASGLSPERAFLQDGHGHFLAAGRIHFLTHDPFHVLEHPKSQGPEPEHAGRSRIEESRLQQELLGTHGGVSRNAVPRSGKHLTGKHRFFHVFSHFRSSFTGLFCFKSRLNVIKKSFLTQIIYSSI